jgi:hypothetical protein
MSRLFDCVDDRMTLVDAVSMGRSGHRRQCVREGKVSCSVLPWDYGKHPPPPDPTPTATATPMSREDELLCNLHDDC